MFLSLLERDAVLKRKRDAHIEWELFGDILSRDTTDQFRTFDLLERWFENPDHYMSESIVQLEPSIFRKLVGQYVHIKISFLSSFRYYAFDDKVMKELAGKKLRPRLRSNLDDVSDKSKVSIKKCRRQVRHILTLLIHL